MKRNLGEGNLSRIELMGTPIEGLRPRFQTALSTLGL